MRFAEGHAGILADRGHSDGDADRNAPPANGVGGTALKEEHGNGKSEND